MNLTLVISSLRMGGAEGVMARIATGLAERGHAVRLLTLDGCSGPSALPLHPAIRRHALGLAGPSSGALSALAANIHRVRTLRQAILDEPPQAVLSFMTETNVLTLLAVGGRVPVAVGERVHPGRHPVGKLWSALRRLTYPRAAAIAVQTTDVADFFPPSLRSRCVTIPNPVTLPPGGELEPDVARSLDAPGHVLLGMGRLTPQKGFDLLLPAFERIAGDFPDWRLVVLGQGPERERLEAQTQALGLNGRVHFPGRTAAPATALRQASLFVLPSRYEGFPNALAEALACAVPAVAFDCESGPAEILRPEVDGLLVRPEDMNALALALARLMADAELRVSMGGRTGEVLARFGMEAVTRQWETLLSHISAGKGGGTCAA